MDLFHEGKPFFKGNLHCHTTLSDGLLPPEQVIDFYRQAGYDFLAITDHRKLSPSRLHENGLFLLSGIEMDFTVPGEALHIVGIGMEESYARSNSARLGPQACINGMRRYGGRAILAHPAWSLNTTATLTALRHVTAAEIYNSVSTTPWNGQRADASVLLDIAAVHGTPYRFVASDDAHFYNGEAGRSCTMVQAEELTREGILTALDQGRFYASQGPRFEQISLADGKLTLRCSPVETVIFYSNLVWSDARCITRSGQTQAEYVLHPQQGETFLRCQIIDSQGNSAWCNPILL